MNEKTMEAEPIGARPPDRLSVDPRSPFHDEQVLARGIGIRFNGVEKTTVEEYCVSEGWVRMAVGKARDRHGNPTTLKFKGEVEPYFQDVANDEPTPDAAAETDVNADAVRRD